MNIKTIILTIISVISIGLTSFIIRPKQITKLPDGVLVDSHNVGGHKLKGLKLYLEDIFKKQSDSIIKIKIDNEEFNIHTKDISLKHDVNVVINDLKSIFSKKLSFWERNTLKKWSKIGKISFLVPVKYKQSAISSIFSKLKKKIDRPAKDAHIDLINQKVSKSETGRALDLTASMATFEKTLQHGKNEMVATVETALPQISSYDLKNLNLKKVMGWYETSFISWGKFVNRAHNLRVGGSKITGTVIMPGKSISFNHILGPRTAKEGYRVAPIIALGELVDGMGGGMCQIASTLFGAAFFAGLDIIHAKPHSQPSHYIDLGLDATVFYPSVDLVLRNPYEFPVVIRIDVSGGRVRTEILGQKRPYSKIAFIRKIVGELPFKTVFRDDKTLNIGEFKLDQRGQKGFIVRRRRIFKDDKGYELKSQTWTITYPPTTMIIKKGTKKPDDPNYVPPEQEPFRPKPEPRSYRKEEQ